jgi:hypothetical protein
LCEILVEAGSLRLKILCLFGPALSLAGQSYDLLAPFPEGMCRAATPGTTIIDGYEQSYPPALLPGGRDVAGAQHQWGSGIAGGSAAGDLAFDFHLRLLPLS